MSIIRRLIWVLALLCFGSLACNGGDSDEAIGGGIAARWIAEEPPGEESDWLFERELVTEWRLSSPANLAPWQTIGGDPSFRNDRLVLAGESTLVGRVDFSADQVHGIEVTIRGFYKGWSTLFWAGPGQDFSQRRKLTLKAQGGKDEGGGFKTYRFNLLSHDDWEGPIERLRIYLKSSLKTVKIARITCLRRQIKAQSLDRAIREGGRLAMGSDLRIALPAPPGRPISKTFVGGPGQTLRFAYGVQLAVREMVFFSITAPGAMKGEPRQLFSARVDPNLGETGRWFTADVSLEGITGPLRLTLETSSSEDFDLGRGLPAWANLELIDPQQARPGPNVLLICIDTLRADRLSAYGHHRKTSPRIDAWAAKSAVLFANVVAPAPWTLPSHVSMFTGLDAMGHGVNHVDQGAAPPGLEMIAEVFRQAGYHTGAITGGGYLRPGFGFVQGYDSFYYWPEEHTVSELQTGIARAKEWLEQRGKQPFFLFFHTYEVHSPHRRRQPFFDRLLADEDRDLPDVEVAMRADGPQGCRRPGNYLVVRRPGQNGWQAPLTDDEKFLVRAMYDSAIAYTDIRIGSLLKHLARLGLADDTIVLITSDHGEALGEEDRAGHSYLNEYNLMVPLIIALPGGQGAGQVITDQVRLADIRPTLLAAAGLQSQHSVDGVSLLPLIAGDKSQVPPHAFAYAGSSNRGLAVRFANQSKYIFNNTAWSQLIGEEFYDLSSDPDETHDLAATSALTGELRALARSTIGAQHRGLRMRLVNHSDHTLSGRLTGAWTKRTKVKVADAGCRCIHWEGPGKARFELQAGQELTLFFAAISGGRAGLQGELIETAGGKRHRFAEWYDLAEIVEVGLGLSFTGSGWRALAAGEKPLAVGFRIWRTDPVSPTGQEPGNDPEVVDQLRALGYVD